MIYIIIFFSWILFSSSIIKILIKIYENMYVLDSYWSSCHRFPEARKQNVYLTLEQKSGRVKTKKFLFYIYSSSNRYKMIFLSWIWLSNSIIKTLIIKIYENMYLIHIEVPHRSAESEI